MTLLTLIGLPASALTLMMARKSSRDRATGNAARSGALLNSRNRALLVAGGVLGALLLIGSPSISWLLSMPARCVVAVAIIVPVTLAPPLLTGVRRLAEQ